MKAALGRLDRFWFAAAPPRRLAVLRILIGAFSLQHVGLSYSLFPGRVGAPVELYDPVGLAVLLPGPMSPSAFQYVVLALLAANVAFLLGWRHRITGPLFGILITFVFCYRNSWSMIYHSDNLLVLHALILGFTPAADALSLDSWRQFRRRSTSGMPARWGETSWQYGWPIHLICTVTVITYVLAGVAKIAGPIGWSWVTAESLQAQIAVDGLRKEFLGGSAPQLVFTLSGRDELFLAIGVTTLLVELGAPAALLHSRLGVVWSIAALMMHWGIFFIMGIEFRFARLGMPFAAFLPLDRLLPRTAESVVLFDGWCDHCQASRRWAGRLDWFGRSSWVSFRDPAVRAVVPQLTDDQLEGEMWVVADDGRVMPGFIGWRHLLFSFPLTLLPSLVLFVPPVPRLGRRVYQWLASRRSRCDLASQPATPPGPWAAILLRAQQTPPGWVRREIVGDSRSGSLITR